ncbi:MAG: hypothetical protein ABC585_07435 [Candidatus Methanosuratincola petrocarbonis]
MKAKSKACPICHVPILDKERTCRGCAKVLEANPWLTVVDLM